MEGSGQLGVLEWGTWRGKIMAFLGPFRSFNIPVDLIWLFSLIIVFFVITIYGKARVEKDLFFVGSGFLLVSLFAPTTLFTVTFADIRIVLPGIVLITLSFSASTFPKNRYLIPLILLSAAFFRQASIAHGWMQVQDSVNKQRAILERIPPRSKIYPIFVHGEGQEFERFEHPLEFVSLYATIQGQSILPTLCYQGSTASDLSQLLRAF